MQRSSLKSMWENCSTVLWDSEPASFALLPCEVHIWRIGLDEICGREQDCAALLSSDEQRRASAFKFPQHRYRYIVCRAFLRMILGRCAKCDPREVVLTSNSFGKPIIRHPALNPRLEFNLSHSRQTALIAVALERRIGIDVEHHSDEVAIDAFCTQFFSPRETATILALSRDAKIQAFFDCWTRKEAYLKARGEGLRLPLADFDVSLAPDRAALTHVGWDAEEVTRWSLYSLYVENGCSSTLSVEGSISALKCWNWCW